MLGLVPSQPEPTPNKSALSAAFSSLVKITDPVTKNSAFIAIKLIPTIATETPIVAKAVYKTLTAKAEKLPRAEINHENFEHHHATVDGSKKTIVFAMGHGTPIEHAEQAILDFNAMGINVIAIPCPQMNRRRKSADGHKIDKVYQDHIENCIYNPESPIYKLIPDDHEATIIFHSAAAEASEILMEKDDTHAKFLEEKFGDRKINTGILLDTVFSSEGHHPKKSVFYNQYANWFAYHTAGSLELDLYFSGISNDEKPLYLDTIVINATHGQAKVLKNAGAQCVKRIKNSLNLKSTFNITSRIFLSGENENSACVETIKDVCKLIKGAKEVIAPNIKHNPILESAAIRSIIGDAVINGKPFTSELFEPLFRTLKQNIQCTAQEFNQMRP